MPKAARKYNGNYRCLRTLAEAVDQFRPEANGTYLSRYGLLLEEMSAAGQPPSSLHGRIHGVFRKN
jgi:hypothetical protein